MIRLKKTAALLLSLLLLAAPGAADGRRGSANHPVGAVRLRQQRRG